MPCKAEYDPIEPILPVHYHRSLLNKMPFHSIKLNDGRSIPAIGFGSWKIPRDVATHQTGQAIETGFDHIDTAQVYYNEEEVGQAIKESGLSRKELWITTT